MYLLLLTLLLLTFTSRRGYAKTRLLTEWMRKWRVWLKEGGDREKLELNWEKPGPDQDRFIESVTTVTDRRLQLPLSLKQARVTPLSLVWVTSLGEMENSVSLISGLINSEFSLNLLCQTDLRSVTWFFESIMSLSEVMGGGSASCKSLTN